MMKHTVLIYEVKENDIEMCTYLKNIAYIRLYIRNNDEYWLQSIKKHEEICLNPDLVDIYYIDINIEEYHKRADKIKYIKDLYPEYFI